MTFEPLHIVVAGAPATLTAPRAVADRWKEAISEAAAIQWPWGAIYIEENCHLKLTFSLLEAQYHRTSVVNLLKSTIDGLANRVFAPGGPGHAGPWTRADHWIVSMDATKEISVGPGVTLVLSPQITWLDSDPWIRGEWIHVGGRPAVWVSTHEREWKELVTSAVRARIPEPYVTPADVRLSFQIHVDRIGLLDLDNLIYPAVQAIARAIYRSPRSSQNIQRIIAEKTPADDVAAEGLLIGIRGVTSV